MATVLVVDDHPVNRDLLVTLLGYRGHTVLEACDGAEALRIVQMRRLDLVITDLVMPNMSGRELTEQIRRVAPQTRVLWCSGYVRSSNSEEMERFLQKPFTSQDLLRKVKQVLTETTPDTAMLRRQKLD